MLYAEYFALGLYGDNGKEHGNYLVDKRPVG